MTEKPVAARLLEQSVRNGFVAKLAGEQK